MDAYQATQIAPRPVLRGAYDEAVSRGVFNYVGDQNLRSRITNYYLLGTGLGAVLDTIGPYRERLRRQMPFEVTTAIIAHCSDIFTTTDRGAVFIALPEACDPQIPPAEIAPAVAQIRAAPELILDLNRQVSDLAQKLNSFRLLMETAQAIRRDMEARR